MPGARDGLTLTISGQYKDNKQTKTFFADTMRTREYATILPQKVKTLTIPAGHFEAQINLLTKLNAGPINEGERPELCRYPASCWIPPPRKSDGPLG